MRKTSSPSKNDAAKARSQVAAYLAKLPADTRRRLKKMRADIRAAVPSVVDGFSYGIPSFKLDGKTLVWYAAFKEHTSLFPMLAAVRHKYAAELKGYKVSTGTVQFPLDKPLPSGLVKRLMKARVAHLRAGGR